MFFFSLLTDLESNSDLNNDDYEYEDEAKLVIFPDHYEIPLPNIEELPALVSEWENGIAKKRNLRKSIDSFNIQENLYRLVTADTNYYTCQKCIMSCKDGQLQDSGIYLFFLKKYIYLFYLHSILLRQTKVD